MVIRKHYQRFGFQPDQDGVCPFWDERYEHYPAFRFLYLQEKKRALEVVLTSGFHLHVGLLTQQRKRFVYTTGEGLQTLHLMRILEEEEHADSRLLSWLQWAGKTCVQTHEAVTKRQHPSLARWVDTMLLENSTMLYESIYKYIQTPREMNLIDDNETKVETILTMHPESQLLFASFQHPDTHYLRVFLIVSDGIPWLMDVDKQVQCYPITRTEEFFFASSNNLQTAIRCWVEPFLLRPKHLLSVHPKPDCLLRVYYVEINPSNPALLLYAYEQRDDGILTASFGLYVFPILMLYAFRKGMPLSEVFSVEAWQHLMRNILE